VQDHRFVGGGHFFYKWMAMKEWIRCISRYFPVTLCICLCLGSLVIIPITNVVDLSTGDVTETDFENSCQFDQADLDDGFLTGTFVSATIDGWASSKSWLLTWDIPTSCLSPEFPPPKS
jgi:hypothetical protein